MHPLLLVALATLGSFTSSIAWADSSSPDTTPAAQSGDRASFGVLLSAGSGAFIGDLSNEKGTTVVDLQLELLFVRANTLPLSGFLTINALFTSTHHTGSQFPYDDNAELTIRSFLFIPHLCGHLGDAVEFCGGIGQGTVNVNSEGQRRDWGTWNYQLMARFHLWKGVSAALIAKYVGKVEQEVDGVGSDFSFLTGQAGLGWRF